MRFNQGINAVKKGAKRLGHLDVSTKFGLGALGTVIGTSLLNNGQETAATERARKNQDLLALSKKIDKRIF